jgi:hypothetical protein
MSVLWTDFINTLGLILNKWHMRGVWVKHGENIGCEEFRNYLKWWDTGCADWWNDLKFWETFERITEGYW